MQTKQHEFKIGSQVSLSRSFPRAAEGAYTIVRILPREGDISQYQIKSENEPNLRVVKEFQIRPWTA